MNISSISTRRAFVISVLIIGAFAAVLFFMGQPLICKCGFVKFWHGPTALTSENSQHISDWYTFSHIINGFLFYWILWFVKRKFSFLQNVSLGGLFLIALSLEMAWELFENTDFIINRYRSITISYDYFGDSVINSASDVLAMVLGFVIARRAPVWLTIMLLVGMELFVGYWIRDNLLLNIVMLLYPFEFILKWQRGG